jgi:hypothetical protein
MKNFLVILLLFIWVDVCHAQNVAINATGSSPDTSAMLDISSSSKGLLIPQISLSTLTDAATIAVPAHSLLVYNTNASLSGGKGYYYNSGTTGSPVWVKLSTSGTEWQLTGNTGTNPATDYIGTTDSTNLLIKTKATQRIKITGAGITTIGDGTNNTRIEADGSLFLEGTATAFTDIVVPLFNSRLGNTNQAQWVQMKNDGSTSRGVYTFTFANQTTANEEEVFFSVQLPHNWKEGTAIQPHVHWSPQTTGQNGVVVWGLEYTWVNYVSAAPIAFPNTTIITTNTATITGTSDADKHMITSFASITPSNTQDKISSLLMCRFYRKSGDAADTYNGNAAVLSVDFHYEIDGFGSRTEFAK